VYGATTQEKLQGVAGQPPDDEKFMRKLAAKGVPDAICDMLFGKYVAPSKGEPKMPMRAPEEVAKEYLDGVIGADVGGRLELPEFDYPASFPRNEGAGAVTLRCHTDRTKKLSREVPNMLLAGLERDTPLVLSGELLDDVVSAMESGVRAVLAVSGQGKTRLACEALSQRFGLFLVMQPDDDASLNPSSVDLADAVREMTDMINAEGDAALRLTIVRNRIAGVLLSRVLVLERLLEETDNELTPYQWLLAQMYPQQLLGADVFRDLRARLAMQVNPSHFANLLIQAAARVRVLLGIRLAVHRRGAATAATGAQRPVPRGDSLLVFLDEAQLLAGFCKNMFLSANGELNRDLFATVIKALVACAGTDLTYPVLSGTGFSMEQLVGQAGSSMGKDDTGSVTFFDFKWAQDDLTSLAFIKLLADITQLDKDVVAHVGGWLVGRARWSASFATCWLHVARGLDTGLVIDPAELVFPFFGAVPTGPSLTLHYALGVFVTDMTARMDAYQRVSRRRETPSSAVARLRREHDGLDQELQYTRAVATLPIVIEAAFSFACKGGVPVSIPVRDRLARPFDTVKLVEKGVCCVRPLDVAGTKRKASALDEHQVEHRVVLAEPLIVEAVMRAFSWQELGSGTMEGAPDASGRGVAFESCAPPVIHAVFSPKEAVDERPFSVRVPDTLKGKWRSGCSACGIIIQPCRTDADLKAWAERARHARFDGQAPPLAAPTAAFGADLLAGVRKVAELSAFRWAFVQLKLAKAADVASAFCTVDPELLLHTKRDTASAARLPHFNDVYASLFNNASPVAARDPVFRVLVDGLAKRKRNNGFPTAALDAAKKHKTDAFLYLDHEAVANAVVALLGDKDGSAYMTFLDKS
jgi:hypothetical protein